MNVPCFCCKHLTEATTGLILEGLPIYLCDSCNSERISYTYDIGLDNLNMEWLFHKLQKLREEGKQLEKPENYSFLLGNYFQGRPSSKLS